MKELKPEQLGRLLDQIQHHYPYGLPREALRRVTSGEPSPRFHFIIVSNSKAITESEMELLRAIASKGLKITENDYSISYSPEHEWEAESVKSEATHVVVFGAPQAPGKRAKNEGGSVVLGSSLTTVATDPGAKKALWRELQGLL